MNDRSDRAGVKKLIKDILPEITEFRRNLHRHPEKGLEEKRTAGLIRETAAGGGGTILPPLMKTDTVIILDGKAPGPDITLRADIDALEIGEDSGRSWSSENKGLSHACGHDGHTAMLMGAYLVLSGLKGEFSGSVRFVFQPGEEGLGGGKKLVKKGLLDTPPRADWVFALHGWPGQPLNTAAAGKGANMAASDRFSLTVRGKGGHGALPHLAVDPILTASSIVQGLQSIVSRMTNPLDPAVISVCSLHSGNADNAIPDTAELKGTTRYFDSAIGERLPELMEECIAGICRASGAGYDFNYSYGYIPLINSDTEVDFVRETVEKWLGSGAWFDQAPPIMTAEDFSYYLRKVPGVYIRLGMGESWTGLHNPAFDFNDEILETGITLMTGIVLEKLGGQTT